MNKYKVEMDDGDGNIEWIDVEAKDESSVVDVAVAEFSKMKPEADSDLMVIISIEITS